MLGVITARSNASPILSILLPTYNYVHGLQRVLDRIKGLSGSNIEVIIGDNSDDRSIQEAVDPILCANQFHILYQWNNPSKSPIANWNWLINSAKGEYVMMIHHDEFPLCEETILDALRMVGDDPSIDAVLLNCHLVYKKKRFISRHFNATLRDFLIRKNPNYLYKRNLIGPTAVLIARKKLYPLFDENLIWLVDVDMYVRLFKQRIHWLTSTGIIFSEQERTNSLTKGLGESIPAIRNSELAYLRKRDNSNDLWLGAYSGEAIKEKIIRMLEWFLWNSYRCCTKGFAQLCSWVNTGRNKS